MAWLTTRISARESQYPAHDLCRDRVPGPVHDRRASDAPGSAGLLRGSRLLDREIDLRARVRGAPGGFDPSRRFVIPSERPQPNSHFRDLRAAPVIPAPLYFAPFNAEGCSGGCATLGASGAVSTSH